MEKSEPDFTDEVIERMLLKRCLTDRKYLGIISSSFDKRWIENSSISTLLYLEIKYFNKYKELPSIKAMKSLVDKYCQKNTELNATEINNELYSSGTMDITVPDEVVKNNLKSYIESKAMFWTISDNIKEIEKDKNVDKCIERFNTIRKMCFEDTNIGLDYFSREGQDSHWKYITNPESKIKTLWDGIDKETHGGFLKDGRMLALICGQAGQGKSLFLSNLGYNFLQQGLSVVVITLEMSENVYGKRFTAHISGDNINYLHVNATDSRNKISEFYAKHPTANLFLKEYPPRSIRVLDVENYLDSLKENGHKFDVVIVDYLNLLLPNTKYDNSYQSMMAVSEQLRALSYKFNVPFISASQFNRAGMNNEDVGIENISDSAGLAFTADFIGLLYRTEGDREKGIINMRLGKNRFGVDGKSVQFKLNPDSLVLNDQTFITNPEDDTSVTDDLVRNLPNISTEITNL